METLSAASQAQSRVRVLTPGVAEKIAAGEVIERPASVVKELVENSLDAGARDILVALENGGKSLIEIVDNGHGMVPEDLEICIERHATSKLSRMEDLETLRSLGFRGEALPSIRAVAETSIVSRAPGMETAFELGLETRAKKVTFGHFIDSAHGTRVRVQGLFSQIPARLKFLKSQASEVAFVRDWLERLALAHPGTGFRLISDNRVVFNLRPQTEADRVRKVLMDGEDFPLISASNELGLAGEEFPGKLKVRVHWAQGLSMPQTRKLFQVVNGRVVRDRLLQQALLGAFRQSLLPGQFPAIALFLEIDPSLIDVNVHPAKTEIRFLESRRVFAAIESVISSMIEKSGAPAVVPTAFSDSGRSFWSASEPGRETRPFDWTQPPAMTEPQATSGPVTQSSPGMQSSPVGRSVGILFNTYILHEAGDELILVDQHAAHERVRYEKLRRRVLGEGASEPQKLLLPEAVRFDAEKRQELENRLPWLEKMGFEAEIFGEDSVLFRSIPGEWGQDALRTRLKNLVERILEAELPRNAISFDETIFEKIASEACHSSVRAGDRLEPWEAQVLVQQLFESEHPWNCPHGRPTVVKVPRGKLEEWFQRRVPG